MSSHTPVGPRLARFTELLQRPDGRVQLGWDPDRAVVLAPPEGILAEEVVGVLRLMDGRTTRPTIMWSALERGIRPDDMTALLTELECAGLLDARPARPRLSVRVHGRGPLSDAVSEALPRHGARVRRSASGNADADARRWNDTCVVLADDLAIEPHLVRDLVRLGIPHLHVRLRDGRGVVGPMVLPGTTSCLRCADLTRSEQDEHWPHLAAQLVGTVGDASPAMILATAALTLAQIDAIAAADPSEPPASLGATLEIDLDVPRVVIRRWPRRTRCSCRYLAPGTGEIDDVRS